MIPTHIKKLGLCSYGCGKPATHKFKNGKVCCSANPMNCPASRKKANAAWKKWYANLPEESKTNYRDSRGKPIESYLKKGVELRSNALRKCLLKAGFDYKCAICGLTEWHGKKMTLQIHHKNCTHNDNRVENLIILCPNCHSVHHNIENRKPKPKK